MAPLFIKAAIPFFLQNGFKLPAGSAVEFCHLRVLQFEGIFRTHFDQFHFILLL